MAGVDHVELIEFQILQRSSHGGGEDGGISALALDTDAARALEQHEVDFRTAMRGPEIRFIGPYGLEDLFHGIPFPGGADFRMIFEIKRTGDVQQCVQETGVADVDFRRFHLSFAEIFRRIA